MNLGLHNFSFFISLLLICTSLTTPREELEGVWVYKSDDRGSFIFKKSDDFDEDSSGIEFKSDGTSVIRRNSIWCGAPPITYKNYRGTWKMSEDSSIRIRFKNWSQERIETWKIIKISEKLLVMDRVDIEFPEEAGK